MQFSNCIAVKGHSRKVFAGGRLWDHFPDVRKMVELDK